MVLNKTIKIVIAAAISLVLVAVAFIFYTFDPDKAILFPRCPFLSITGYECPGCGSQRAMHNILHLNFGKAFAQNALMLFLVPYLLLGAYIAFFGGKERFPRLEKIFFGKWSAIVVISAILIFWVLRNVRGLQFV